MVTRRMIWRCSTATLLLLMSLTALAILPPAITVAQDAASLRVAKTADPELLSAPGGTVTYTVEVKNTGDVVLRLLSLVDVPYGDLTDDAGNDSIFNSTCRTGVDLGSGALYACTFQVEVGGQAGDTLTDTVTATARDEPGNRVEAVDSATVTIARPSLRVAKTADPDVVAPGRKVKYTVQVKNNSTGEVPLTVTSLYDDVYGELTDTDKGNITQNTCELAIDSDPIVLARGEIHTCTFVAKVWGEPGETLTDTVTATAVDRNQDEVQAQASATVTIAVLPPDTGIELPTPFVAGGLGIVGAALLVAGVVVRRGSLRTG